MLPQQYQLRASLRAVDAHERRGFVVLPKGAKGPPQVGGTAAVRVAMWNCFLFPDRTASVCKRAMGSVLDFQDTTKQGVKVIH
jgi:hypothetical protein